MLHCVIKQKKSGKRTTAIFIMKVNHTIYYRRMGAKLSFRLVQTRNHLHCGDTKKKWENISREFPSSFAQIMTLRYRKETLMTLIQMTLAFTVNAVQNQVASTFLGSTEPIEDYVTRSKGYIIVLKDQAMKQIGPVTDQLKRN